MKRFLLGTGLCTVGAGVVCLLTVMNDIAGEQQMSSKRMTDLLMCGLVLPHLGVMPIHAAGRMF